MKKFQSIKSCLRSDMGVSLAAAMTIVSVAVALSGCGGGGGTTAAVTTPVVPVAPVVNAPKLTLTSASPMPVASVITVSSDVALVGVTSVSINTPQATTLPGNAALSADKKTITITPSAALPYATTLTVTVRATANGVEGSVTGTVLTESAPVACVLPQMANSLGACISPPGATGYTWNNVIKAWVANVGTLVIGVNVLPDTCLYIGDACWKANVANGTIKFVNTGAVLTGTPAVGRPVVFALYVVGNVGFANGASGRAIVWADSPDMMSISNMVNESVTNMTITERLMEARGTKTGALFNFFPNKCYSLDWSSSFLGFPVSTTTCPI